MFPTLSLLLFILLFARNTHCRNRYEYERRIEARVRENEALPCGQISRRGWNIKISVQFTAGGNALIVILARYFLCLLSECLSFRIF
jgi:hypothetical protein